mgnify:CR=1 FL=1|jgi:hypothetical protein
MSGVRAGMRARLSLGTGKLLVGAAVLRTDSRSGVSARKVAAAWNWSDLVGLPFVLVCRVVKSFCERS